MAIAITSANFENEVLKSDLPVLLDFWATWCPPCKAIAPFVDQISKEYALKLKVGKVNVEDASDIATRYQVMNIPTLLIIKQGKVMEKKVGAIQKNELVKFITPYV